MNLSICNFINWSGKACDSMHSRGAHTVHMGGHTCIIEEHIHLGVGHMCYQGTYLEKSRDWRPPCCRLLLLLLLGSWGTTPAGNFSIFICIIIFTTIKTFVMISIIENYTSKETTNHVTHYFYYFWWAAGAGHYYPCWEL